MSMSMLMSVSSSELLFGVVLEICLCHVSLFLGFGCCAHYDRHVKILVFLLWEEVRKDIARVYQVESFV